MKDWIVVILIVLLIVGFSAKCGIFLINEIGAPHKEQKEKA